MEPFILALLEDRGGKVRLGKGFAASHSYSSSGLPVEGLIFPNFLDHRLRAHLMASNQPGLCITDMGTRAAILAKLSAKGYSTIFTGDGIIRADVYAVLAAYTSLGMEKEFRLEVLRFGVRAPRASQVTSLQEHESPYARPIVEGKPLDVKDNALFVHILPFLASFKRSYAIRSCPYCALCSVLSMMSFWSSSSS
jgi:hypothetical protein